MTWAIYGAFVAVLVVLAIIGDPLLAIIFPVAIAGSYGLLWLIMKLVNPPWRPPPHQR